MTLADLVDAALPSFGSYEAIAREVPCSHSALLRAMKGESVFGTDKLLALAEAIGASPDVALRAAGKRDTADRLVRLYKKPPAPLSTVDRRLVALSPAQKRAALALTTR